MSGRQKSAPAGRLRAALRWTLALALLAVMAGSSAWGLAWVLEPDTLPLARVRIDGDIRHTDRAQLKRVLAAYQGDGFFGIDLEAVRTALEALPWVTRASVRRVWPGALEVWVEERRALARWGGDALVSPEGEVFRPRADSVPAGLALLSGPEGSAPQVVERYGRLRERLARDGLEIAELALNARHAWTLELAGGPHLELGKRDLETRVERFLRHVGELRRQGVPERVDLRYANGFAVRPHPPAGEAENTGTEG